MRALLSRRHLMGVAAAAAFAGAATARAAEDPKAFVKQLGDDALQLLINDPGSDDARRERLRELLHRGFDLKTIGRAVLGPHWKQADADQQARYLKAFEDFIVTTYSVRLKGYAGETFEVLQERPVDDKDTLVLTKINRPNREPLHVDYRVRKRETDLKIVDVLVEGVSMLTSQRQEFSSVVQRKGIDGLIAQLEQRVSELSQSY